MTPDRWTRQDVNPDDLFEDEDGSLWRVVGVADEPTVALRRVDSPSDPVVSHVISSLNFSRFRKRVMVDAAGQRLVSEFERLPRDYGTMIQEQMRQQETS